MNRPRRILTATIAALALTASLALAAEPSPSSEPASGTNTQGGHSGHGRMASMPGTGFMNEGFMGRMHAALTGGATRTNGGNMSGGLMTGSHMADGSMPMAATTR